MLRLMHTIDVPPELGWIEVTTPLGASAHVQVNGVPHELCEDWRLLTTGRMRLVQRANFAHWFGPMFEHSPVGLVAELLAANEMVDHFAALVATQVEARTYILGLPPFCHALDRERRSLLNQALDIARRLEVRVAARAAAREALE